ncbi:Hsp20 family protein [Yunchengibacter salinarum]|uniref:Hsp20 family protein n=1 Tax=Yunchengibacter salinarum TaxID=3133399 RepID=UPI0035B5D3AB
MFDHKLLLGFDALDDLFEQISRSGGDGYPPYNIEQHGPDDLRISIAVAGFSRDELDIIEEPNQLWVRGRQEEADGDDRTYLHRGIAARQFQRRFLLSDGIEVTGARLENGLLHIDLNRPQPAAAARRIPIG